MGYWTDNGNNSLLFEVGRRAQQPTTGQACVSTFRRGLQNARKFYVNVPSVLVTPHTDEYVQEFNDPVLGCPCGGTWAVSLYSAQARQGGRIVRFTQGRLFADKRPAHPDHLPAHLLPQHLLAWGYVGACAKAERCCFFFCDR